MTTRRDDVLDAPGSNGKRTFEPKSRSLSDGIENPVCNGHVGIMMMFSIHIRFLLFAGSLLNRR
ncbi:hypothetical protein [Bauldia litoralis]|uniref:hypothetical protein n=1 Tax=Bauldia litoralis TaxID=665467 RepID=UPI001113B635|nr:hypothetical protein [Bauldia litoralis]